MTLQNKIDANEQQILLVNSKNLALNAELDRKKDVEKQLEEGEKMLTEANKKVEDSF